MNTLTTFKPSDGIKIFLYGVLFTGLFYSSHSVMVSGWEREDYNYAYLIPVVVLYLIWEKKTQLSELESRPSWYGAILIFAGIFFYLLGELGGEYLTMYISSWFFLVGVCWIHLGWQKLKIIAFPLCVIPTMFPLPNFLYTKITLKLQLISSKLGVAVIQLYGLSAYREGNVIDLGFTQLQVVEACSGLRYLFPLLVLGILLAYFFKAALWKRIVLVLSTIPLSIITNSLRIAMTGILFEIWGPVVADEFFHGFSGWIIFVSALAVMLLEMWILGKVWGKEGNAGRSGEIKKKRDSRGKQGAEGDEEESNRQYAVGDSAIGETFETGSENPGSGIKRHESGTGWKAFWSPLQFLVAVVLLGATLAFSQGVDFREKIPISKSFDEFPLDIGEWSGVRSAFGRDILDALDLSDYISVDYRNGSGKNVNFYVAYYESQRKGESIHSPATCLPGGGWEYKQAGKTTIFLSQDKKETMNVNQAFMQLGDMKQLSYYWFPKGGRILTNAYQLKLYTFWDALTKQRTDGALVRLITSVYDSEELADAEERLQGFARKIQPVLSEFLPR